MAQSPPQGLLVLDDTGLPKQGRGSVGVARQYSGTLGKVANGQVVVRAHDVADEPTNSAPVHWPLTAQLSLPEVWVYQTGERDVRRPATDRSKGRHGSLEGSPSIAQRVATAD